MDHDDLAKVLDELKVNMLADIAQDQNAPSVTPELFKMHWEKPWVPNFLACLISPLRPTLRSYLKLSVIRANGHVWYIPSANWWRAHTMEAHGPDGYGCDVDEHVKKLTDIGEKAHFLYADLLRDGRLRVLGEDDFKIEAGYWKANFPLKATDEGGTNVQG
jgi:hypothetical protein